MAIVARPRASERWSRAYPPLILLVVAVVVAAFILPSALNLPQSNPSTVLEYAPVPPEDDTPPPPNDGNVASLGLGTTGSLLEGGEPPPPPPPPDEGAGSKPTDKQCVGDPPRQTEDPMSPPCVPFFEGDNFGATYQGVTGDEIKVLVYIDRGCYGTTGNGECPSVANFEYKDLNDPPKPACPGTWPANNPNPDECDFPPVRVARTMVRYFNDRFQTYGRKVHGYLYMTTAATAASRRKDAADNWEKLKPFAVIDSATFGGHNEAYQQAMAARGVLVFSQETALPNSFFQQADRRAWAFWPDIEHWAESYVTYICTKVAPFKVAHSGNPQGTGTLNGRERKYGFFSTSDPSEPGLKLFASLVETRLEEECGVVPTEKGTFSNSGFAVDGSDTGQDQTETVIKFQSADVTTVLYLGGIETKFSAAADAANYYPEIVVAGDLDNDNYATARLQNQEVWQNAWAVTYQIRMNRLEDTPGYRAYKEVDQSDDTNAGLFARDAYRDFFMLFQAIQVAGPRLNPDTVDKGFHAIPEKESTDPYQAAFFFDPDDYTSVKDAAEQWWDRDGRRPGANEPGCWRMVREGRRFLAGRWEGADDVFVNGADPCSGYGGGARLRLA